MRRTKMSKSAIEPGYYCPMKAITACAAPALRAMALLVAIAGGQAVRADDGPSAWGFSGYGTLGWHHLSTDDTQYSRDLAQRDGDQPQSGWLSESRLGLQAAYRFSPQTHSVVQVVVHDQVRMKLQNLVEWAFVSHQPTPNLQVRAGRMGADFYMLSELRSLDYSQTNVRPAFNFYGYIPLNSIDGLDAAWTLPDDSGDWRLKAQYGEVHADVHSYRFKAKDYLSVSATRNTGPWRVRVGYATLLVDTNAGYVADLVAGLGAVAAIGIPGISSEATSLAHDLSFKGARATYASVSAGYDDGIWVAQGEISSARVNRKATPLGDAAYLTVGRRFGAWTPFAEVSTFQRAIEAATPQTNWLPVLGPQAAALQGGALLAINSSHIDQSGYAFGVRWDFHRQAALKLQWDRIDIGKQGYGNFPVPLTHPQNATSVDLVTAAINWVF